jgi:hypothetical protein
MSLGGSARSAAICDLGHPAGVTRSVPPARFTTMTGSEQALSPPAWADTTTTDVPGMCYK